MKSKAILRIIPALAAAFLGSALHLPAQDAPTPQQNEEYQRKLFALVDANNDGKVTMKEFAVITLWDEFQKYDANGDGKVSKAEYDKQPKKKDQWAELDTTGKGYLTFEDCINNQIVREALSDDWNELLKKLNKPGANYITLADLPDLTP